MPMTFLALPTDIVRAHQSNAPDANGQKPGRYISDGGSNPCRHCLTEIPQGDAMLVLAYRPFPCPQPYAEIGPIFLCAKKCKRHPDSTALPAMFGKWDRILLRGYDMENEIVCDTGDVVAMSDIEATARRIFTGEQVAYIHMRSASNNCYQCRIERE